MAITFAIKRLTSAAILQPSSSKHCGPVMVDSGDVLELVQSYNAATDELKKSQDERDALAAQIALLVQALKDVSNPLARFNRLASLSGDKINGMATVNMLKDPETYKSIAQEALNQYADKTPQQCLAEIKADAIESVITEELYKRLKPLCGKNGVSEVEDYLTEQAAKVRGGAV